MRRPAPFPARPRIAAWLALPFVLLLALAGPTQVQAQAQAEAPFPVDVYLFHGDGCPHCANAIAFLRELREDHPTLHVYDYEVYNDAANQRLFAAFAAAYGRTVQGVPMLFLGDEAWSGFGESTARDLRLRVDQYEAVPAPDPLARLDEDLRAYALANSEGVVPPPAATAARVGPVATPGAHAGSAPGAIDTELAVPLVGSVDLATMSLVLSTALIGLVDGVNPCSLWVLALLLGVVLGTGSRRRVMLIGGTFLVLAAAVYAAFIAGMFEVLAYLSMLGWIRVVVAVLAGLIAAVHIKDYVAFKQGLSFTTPDAAKPGIYKGIRRVMRAEGSLFMTLGATGALAVGVTLVELPCTIGLPVVWSALVADAGVGRGVFGGLLSLYMLLYLFDELVIFGVAVVTLRAARVGESGARVLKLLSGSVMLALAVAMLQFPEALGSLTGTVVVFGTALGGAGAVLLAHRWLHPQSSPFGGTSGSERA